MRWQALFADLEAQAQSLATLERAAEVEERARAEIGQLRLADRLRTSLGAHVRVSCQTGLDIAGTLDRTGPDWLLMTDAGGGEFVIAVSAVLTVAGLSRYSAVPDSAGAIETKPMLRNVLRAIARDRSAVRVYLNSGTGVDGTIDRIGADFIEIAAHAPGESRRREHVRELRTVALAAIVCLRRDAAG